MQVQGNKTVDPAMTHAARAESDWATVMIAQHSSRFGSLDTRALALALLGGPQQPGGAATTLGQINAHLTPVEQGNLHRDIGDIVKAVIDAIAKFFGSLFGGTTARPTSASDTPAPQASTAPVPALPPAAAQSAAIPGVAAIARNPVVARAIDAAWTASNPHTPGAKVETGFWVVRDDRSGALSVVQFPSNGTNDSLTPGAPPSIDGKTTVAFFHTHPNTAAEGYTSGPSSADQRFAAANNIPGIIRSHDGMYYFNP